MPQLVRLPASRTSRVARIPAGALALCLLALTACSAPLRLPHRIELSGTWRVKDYAVGTGVTKHAQSPDADRSGYLPAPVPGTVREALVAAGEIPDPYYGYENEKSLWIEEKEWWYVTSFRLDPRLRGHHPELVFEGTSFLGEVWLNGEQIGELKGTLNPRRLEVEPALNYEGENVLAVRLEAPPDARRNKREQGLTWAILRDQLYSIPMSAFGWDWVAHMVPIGIWRPVRIEFAAGVRVESPQVITRLPSHERAELDVSFEVRNPSARTVEAEVKGTIRGKNFACPPVELRQALSVPAGATRRVTVPVTLNQPQLWWPNGMGAQNLYLLELEASEAGKPSHSARTQFGVRELKLVDNEDIAEFVDGMKAKVGSRFEFGNVVGAYPWTFEINGKKMFAKGANWIPADQMLRLPRSRYEHLLTLAREANFNLLRVWGGGLYELDDFYELADEYGILTWQEFLSNCPLSKLDRESFMDGARSATLRLRNHPSLAFWCGGNEFDPDDAGSKAVVDGLEQLLAELDPTREFHRASPYMGDDHHWGVWHGHEEFTRYRRVVPFRSESGVNTFPVFENYKKFTPEEKLWPLDPTWVEYRGEMNPRFEHLKKLDRYANEFGPSTTLEEYISKSQLYQALGNEFNLEYSRMNKFRTSGILVWQLNDAWPAISWSLIDWYGTPKPSYYRLKRASQPLHIALDFEKYVWAPGEVLGFEVHLLNDGHQRMDGLAYEFALLDLEGRPLTRSSGTASVEANRNTRLGTGAWNVPATAKNGVLFLSARLRDPRGRLISDAFYPMAIRAPSPAEPVVAGAVTTTAATTAAATTTATTASVATASLATGTAGATTAAATATPASATASATATPAAMKPKRTLAEEFANVFADLKYLPNTAPTARLSLTTLQLDAEGRGSMSVTLSNPVDRLAFFTRLHLDLDSEAFHAFYDDNYVTLLPGESREFTLRVQARERSPAPVHTELRVTCWNSAPQKLAVQVVPAGDQP